VLGEVSRAMVAPRLNNKSSINKACQSLLALTLTSIISHPSTSCFTKAFELRRPFIMVEYLISKNLMLDVSTLEIEIVQEVNSFESTFIIVFRA